MAGAGGHRTFNYEIKKTIKKVLKETQKSNKAHLINRKA